MIINNIEAIKEFCNKILNISRKYLKTANKVTIDITTEKQDGFIFYIHYIQNFKFDCIIIVIDSKKIDKITDEEIEKAVLKKLDNRR